MIVPVLLAAWLQVLPPVVPEVHENPGSGMRTLEVGAGRSPLVLLHGYGSTPEEWLPFSRTILLSADERFVFPEALLHTTPPDGPTTGRAWWRLGLADYRRRGELPDLSASRPAGIGRAARATHLLLKEVQARLGAAPDTTVLGGFSQGAMVAADVAFLSDEPLRALVLLSGTLVDERAWTLGMARRKGLPVFIAHGRQDDVLRFDIAERLQRTMREAGLDVTWIPFEGRHEMPASVVSALNEFLGRVRAAPPGR